MLTAQWIELWVEREGWGVDYKCSLHAWWQLKNSAQNLNVTARTEQIKCVNYGAIFSGKNIKTKRRGRGGGGRKRWQILVVHTTMSPCGNRECRDGPCRTGAWWLHFNGQIKNQCPNGTCTYFVLKLSKLKLYKINIYEKHIRKEKRRKQKQQSVDRTPIVRMEMATMSSVGRHSTSLNPINLHKLVTFRVQQLLVNIWSRCHGLWTMTKLLPLHYPKIKKKKNFLLILPAD